MSIILKSKQQVTNADAINSKDAHVVAAIRTYDSFQHSGSIVYSTETISEAGDVRLVEDGVEYFILTESEVNSIFAQVGLGITAGATYHDANYAILTAMFLHKVGADGRYGLVEDDWEAVV